MLEKEAFYTKRQNQMKQWFWTHLRENLLDALLSDRELNKKLCFLEGEVMSGTMTPGQASDLITKEFIVKRSLI